MFQINLFMKNIFVYLLLLVSFNAHAQKYYTKNGLISFFSKSSLENIEAKNNEVLSIINTSTGDFQFSLLNTGFHFEKALMEEHFNDDYIESSKYPKSTFKGKITNLGDVNFTKDGIYNVSVSGDLTIHGVTNTVTSAGVITIKNGAISAASKFIIKLKDYNITIPNMAKNNISETIEIGVSCTYPNKI